MKNEAILLLGGNIGMTRVYFLSICDQLEKRGTRVIRKSSLYSSPPWGFEADQDFLNQALLVECDGDENNLLELILSIENYFGRERKDPNGHYESRVIDIDILSYGNKVIREDHLILPHPRMHERKFALIPLKEIAPEWIHPSTGKKIEELLADCSDKAEVKIVSE